MIPDYRVGGETTIVHLRACCAVIALRLEHPACKSPPFQGRAKNRTEECAPSASARKTPSWAWRPGQSGNPGGRPKVSAEIRDLARDHGAKAIERLVALMYSKNESVAIRAAEALLDRGYGRPMQRNGSQWGGRAACSAADRSHLCDATETGSGLFHPASALAP